MAAPAPRLRWAQVMAWRAARHHLDERVPAKAMLEVVARIAGLHAQVMTSAELALAARRAGGRCSSRPPPARARRAAEAEAERLAAFSGGELELSWVGA